MLKFIDRNLNKNKHIKKKLSIEIPLFIKFYIIFIKYKFKVQ